MLKKQVRNLTKQIEEWVYGESEKMLDISLIDRDFEQLAGVLNQHNQKQRYIVACASRHEARLKESISNISHDLRTPLTVILGHLQLLQKSGLNPEQRQRINIIFNKTERMRELIGSFYELSILDSDQITLQKEKINLSNLLLDLLADYTPQLENRKIHPEILLPDYSVILLSDRGMVERLFQNLLSNAIRYTAGSLKVSLSKTEKNRILFCIENTVQNAGQINIERIFDRFYTGDPARHAEGTGLGLAVVKLLTEKLDGQIFATVHSDVFTIKVIL